MQANPNSVETLEPKKVFTFVRPAYDFEATPRAEYEAAVDHALKFFTLPDGVARDWLIDELIANRLQIWVYPDHCTVTGLTPLNWLRIIQAGGDCVSWLGIYRQIAEFAGAIGASGIEAGDNLHALIRPEYGDQNPFALEPVQ